MRAAPIALINLFKSVCLFVDFLGIAVQFFESVVYVNHQAEFLGTQAGYKVVVCAEERDVNVVVHHYGRCIE